MTLLHSAQALASTPSTLPPISSLLRCEAPDDPTTLSAIPYIHPGEVPPFPTSQETKPPADAESMLMRLDPEVILSCTNSIDTLISQSTETKRGMNGLRRSRGLFEVDGMIYICFQRLEAAQWIG